MWTRRQRFCTRRLFLRQGAAPDWASRRSAGLLRRGLAGRTRERRPARTAALRAQGEARHLSVPVRRAVADGPVRLQAAAAGISPGTELPDSDPHGAAADRHDVRRRPAFRSRRPCFKFRQHGASGAWVSELMPHLAKVVGRPLLHQVDVHRGDQPRSGGDLLPDRISACRPAVDRRLAGLWPGQREQGSAGVRGDDLAGQRQSERSAAGRPPVGQRLSADAIPGREVPLRRRSGAVPVGSGRIQPAGAPALHRRSWPG